MRRHAPLFAATAVTFASTQVSADPARAQVVAFSVALSTAHDGQPETNSEVQLRDADHTPVVSMLTLWRCASRPTKRTEAAVGGMKVTTVGKELICFIPDTEKDKPWLTQVGTGVVCSPQHPTPESSSFYIREGTLLVRFTLRCEVKSPSP